MTDITKTHVELATILVIPDTQVEPGDPLDHLGWIGEEILSYRKRNLTVVQIGDHAHMASLSSYDVGRREMEGRRYRLDIEAANTGFDLLNAPLERWNSTKVKNHDKSFTPRRLITLGNHENRINVATSLDPKLHGTISTDDLNYADHGWEVHPFLDVVMIEGIAFSHYFVNNANGRPMSGMIDTRIKNVGCSFVQGHQQGLKIGIVESATHRRRRGIVAGSCYLKNEDYRGPQGRNEWRGILVLHEAQDGDYCLMEVSLDFLCRKYEGVGLASFMAARYAVTWGA